MRGITLQEICSATKIGVRMLDAIETDRFDRLPGGVFDRGFVRQYARYLGLDEDRVLADFGAAPAAPPEQAMRKPLALVEGESQPANIPLVVFGVLVVIAALVAGGWRLWKRVEPLKPATVKQSVVPPATPPPAAPVAETVPADGPHADGVSLRVDATDRCWITVTADGRPSWKAPMKAGDTRTITADQTVQLEVDNAAALNITLNGEAQPSLGSKGETKTVTYSKGKRP